MSWPLTVMYREVFGREYIRESKNHILIQKMTYLFKALGLWLGDFLYLWDEHGPFSLEVREQVLNETDIPSNQTENNEFRNKYPIPDDIQIIISQIKDIKNLCPRLENGQIMPIEDWFELVSSIHYLKNNVVGYGGDIKAELLSRKGAEYLYGSYVNEALTVVGEGLN